MNTKIKVISVAHHRNGVGGNPFYVVLFTSKDTGKRTMVGIVFEERASVAVLDVGLLVKGDIAFASNSWRGDIFEDALRETINSYEENRK